MSSFRRRMMMAANVNSTIGDYIQDGLAFHLDCADCDLTQGVWIDKKGGVSFAMSNVSVDSLGGVVFNGSNSRGTSNASVRCPVDTSTIEVAIRASKTRNQFVFDSGVAYSMCYAFYNSLCICSKTLRTNCLNISSLGSSSDFLTNSLHFGTDKFHIENGNIGTFNSKIDYWGNQQYFATIGQRNDNTYKFLGTIYQIRIYNRLLTAEEMIHNQQIDMHKYNSN